jgi:GT2 family glycosyltransferase/glycosyltransferase involved in cell wall biosynthesis
VGDLTWRRAREERVRLAQARHRRRTRAERRDPEPFARAYFDAPWYAAQHPEAGPDPWRHYRATGIAAGFAPNPVFDVATYRFDHPDLASGDDPLVHWVLEGRWTDATPHPLFDPAWYRRAHPDIGATEPYLHYLTVGRAEGRATSAAVEPGTDIAGLRPALPVLDDPATARVTVIIPSYRRLAVTLRCLFALGRRTPPELRPRFLLTDDDPTRPVAAHLADIPGLALRANAQNLGFLRNVNAAAREATGEHLVLLNNDTVVEAGWLEALLAIVDRDPEVGLVGARLIEPDGRLQEAGVIMYRDGAGVPYGRGDDPDRHPYRYVREVDCVSGSCLLVRRSAWEGVGGFDEAYAPAFFEEYDLAYRLRRAGHRVVYQPAARIHHAGSATYGIETRDRQTLINGNRFRARFAAELATAHPGPDVEFLARERPHPGGVALVIDDRVPEPDRHAGALLTWQHLHLLQELGIRPVYLPFDGVVRQPWTARLEADGIEVLAPGVDPAAWLVDHGRFLDWVMVARPVPAERWIPGIRRWTDAALVYFTHDLHGLRERRRAELTGDPEAAEAARALDAVERSILSRADAVLTPSSAEVPVIREMAPGRYVGVLPPFVEPGLPPAADPPLDERTGVMFLGGFEHLPNIDAAEVLVRDVMPRVWAEVPEARVLIVGSDPTPDVLALAGDRVEVTGYVPDLGPVFARSRMTVSALRYGAGLKGKIVTSLEAGVPVVTTAIGNEGLDLRDGEEALLGETPDELAAAVVRLFREPGLAARLATGGHARVAQGFSREAVRTALRTALDEARRHRAAARG